MDVWRVTFCRRNGCFSQGVGFRHVACVGEVTNMAEPVLGEIRMLAGSGVPPGWAACDGQVLAIREHRELYAVLGNTYGGDGKTTFALPDLRGRVALHSSPGTLNPGATGGEAVHRLSSAEVPGHAHGALGLVGPGNAAVGTQYVSSNRIGTASTAATTTVAPSVTSTTSGAAHDNLQPYLTVNYVIAIHGVSPSRK
jgi:microcystin-dependent protein